MISVTLSCEAAELPALRSLLELWLLSVNVHEHSPEATKSPFGSYPANFEEAPVKPKEPEPGRNKYGRYDSDVSPEIDAEILRLRTGGLDCREIAAELEKSHGVSLHYRRVQGRLSTAARQKNTLSTLKRTESYFSDKTDERILELEFDDLSSAEISEKLKAEGVSIPAADIESRLKELHEVRP